MKKLGEFVASDSLEHEGSFRCVWARNVRMGNMSNFMTRSNANPMRGSVEGVGVALSPFRRRQKYVARDEQTSDICKRGRVGKRSRRVSSCRIA